MEKKFACNLCDKRFTSNSRRHYHLFNTQVPCNLVCRTCGEVQLSKVHYKEHAKGCKEDRSLQMVQAEVQRPQQRRPLPMQDFDHEALAVSALIGDDTLEFTTTQLGNATFKHTFVNKRGYMVDIESKYNIAVEHKYTIRATNAKQAITGQMMYDTMNGMRPGSDLRYWASNMMHSAMRQNDAALHNMYLSDMSRGTVRTLMRTPMTDEPAWNVLSKQEAYNVFNEHARRLFAFILEAGTQSLASAVWVARNNQECLALDGESGWSIVFFQADDNLQVDRTQNDQLVYPDSPPRETDVQLMRMIHTRKNEVIAKLQNLIIKHKDVEECLLKNRRFCTAIVKNTI